MSYVNAGSFMAVGITFAVLGIGTVAARLYVRLNSRNFGKDDGFCTCALALVLAECGIMIAASATNSGGTHSPPGLGFGFLSYIDDQQILLSKFETAFDLIQIVALLCLKLTILFFYRRLFRGRAFNITSWCLIGFSAAWAVTFFVAIAAACGPNFWVNWAPIGLLKMECVDTFAILISLAVFDVVVDLGILITPIPLVWSLQMKTRRKLAVLASLLVGALAISCGITRMAFFAEILGPALLSSGEVAGDPSDDDLGVVSVLMFWGMLEMGVGIVAVCLPVLRPLLRSMSLETVIRSVRSIFSLESLSSRTGNSKSKQAREYPKTHEKSESNSSLTRPAPALVPASEAHNHQAYAWTSGDGTSPDESIEMNGGVWVNRDITQTVSQA